VSSIPDALVFGWPEEELSLGLIYGETGRIGIQCGRNPVHSMIFRLRASLTWGWIIEKTESTRHLGRRFRLTEFPVIVIKELDC